MPAVERQPEARAPSPARPETPSTGLAGLDAPTAPSFVDAPIRHRRRWWRLAPGKPPGTRAAGLSARTAGASLASVATARLATSRAGRPKRLAPRPAPGSARARHAPWVGTG